MKYRTINDNDINSCDCQRVTMEDENKNESSNVYSREWTLERDETMRP